MTAYTVTMSEATHGKTIGYTVPSPARAAAAFWAWLNARANRSLAQAHFDRLDATSSHLLDDVRGGF
jgi:hypothetical protein